MKGRASDIALSDARGHFERAAQLASHSTDARNLLAITQVAQAFRNPANAQAPRRFVDEGRALLGSDPGNATVLGNLGVIYDLVLTPMPGTPDSWALTQADRDILTKQREGLKAVRAR
jgi:hypothetical protein